MIRYFVSRTVPDASGRKKALADLEWLRLRLDVVFADYQDRVPGNIASETLAEARQVSLNLLKLDTSVKAGIKIKRKDYGWNGGCMN